MCVIAQLKVNIVAVLCLCWICQSLLHVHTAERCSKNVDLYGTPKNHENQRESSFPIVSPSVSYKS